VEWPEIRSFGRDIYLLSAVNCLFVAFGGGAYVVADVVKDLGRLADKSTLGPYHRLGSLGLWVMLVGLYDDDAEFVTEMCGYLAMPKHYEHVGYYRRIPMLYPARTELAWNYQRLAWPDGSDLEVEEYWEAALAFTGARRPEEAIRYVRMALETENPMTLWLHLWPFFRELHSERGFEDLVKSMRLPHEAIPQTLKAILENNSEGPV